MKNEPTTLQQAVIYFSDPDNCLNYLVAHRWPNGVECPTCGSKDVGFVPSRRVWQCKTRHKKCQFTIKVGSILEDSPITLDKWLCAMWMMANCKNGVSSWEIHRTLGVTQKTAWFMLQRIRLAMQDGRGGKLSGEVEADETYIGGKARNMHRDRKAGLMKGSTGGVGKIVVMGLLERHGEDGSKVRTNIISSTRKTSIQPALRKHVEAGAKLYTDSHSGYDGLDEYFREFINHAEAYARGNVHTNGLENFWSLLKRGLKGTYVSVEPFHLFRYLDEQAFRFNNRKEMKDADRFSEVVKQVTGRRLTYQELIGKKPKEDEETPF